MVNRKIDINADVGEGIGDDHLLMPLISSCSIACGGHYGDERSVRETIRLAKSFGVNAGAHPSFPDKLNFGRKTMEISHGELACSIKDQILDFSAICKEEKTQIHHIKLHGALYNLASTDNATALAVLEGIEKTGLNRALVLPHSSVLAKKAQGQYSLIFEAFIDRKYRSDLTLVPRSEEDAVITDPVEAWRQLYDMISLGKVTTKENEKIPIVASTYCIHGDNPNALEIMRYIHRQMKAHELTLK